MQRLHSLVLRLFPEADVDLSYRMSTYRFGDDWVALANQKRYVSLYTCSAHHLVNFKQAYPKIKTGKGCINFKLSDEFEDTIVMEVIRQAIEHPK